MATCVICLKDKEVCCDSGIREIKDGLIHDDPMCKDCCGPYNNFWHGKSVGCGTFLRCDRSGAAPKENTMKIVRRAITYDQSCYELAKSFLEDSDLNLSPDDLGISIHSDMLAREIQQTIEDYIDNVER